MKLSNSGIATTHTGPQLVFQGPLSEGDPLRALPASTSESLDMRSLSNAGVGTKHNGYRLRIHGRRRVADPWKSLQDIEGKMVLRGCRLLAKVCWDQEPASLLQCSSSTAKSLTLIHSEGLHQRVARHKTANVGAAWSKKGQHPWRCWGAQG